VNFNLGHINKISSVSVVLTDDGYYFNVVVLKQKKGLLEIVKKEQRLHSVKDLLKVTGQYTSFILHFTGKGILNKKIENRPNYRANILLNANPDEFYFTDVITENFIFSSMIRKSVVTEILEHFNQKLNHIISISTGPFISSVLQPQLNLKQIVVNDYILLFENQNLIDFEKKESNIIKSYTIDSKTLDHNDLSCLGHGALFFNPDKSIILPEDETIFVANKRETEQKNIFIRFGAGSIIFYFLLFFGNRLYVDSLNETISVNYEKLATSEQTMQAISKLKEEKLRKEKMLSSSGLLNKQFLSFYLMELSNSLPPSISFTNVNVRPFLNEVKRNFKIEIEENSIYIIGETESSNVLSEWIQKLERKDWIAKIDILNYFFVKGKGEFELKIEIVNV